MMNLGKFTFEKEVGHYEEKEEIWQQGTPYEHKAKSSRWIKTGIEEVVIEVIIDPLGVARAVSGAVRNKSGVSKYLGGAVIGRRV